jgi:hypothetical protein
MDYCLVSGAPGPALGGGPGSLVPNVVTTTVYRLGPDGVTIVATFGNVRVANLSPGPVPVLTAAAGEDRVPVSQNGGVLGGWIVNPNNGFVNGQPVSSPRMDFPPGYGTPLS